MTAARPVVGVRRRPPYHHRPKLAYAVILLALIFTLAPIGWMTITAFSKDSQIFSFPPVLDRSFTLTHLRSVLQSQRLIKFMVNGVVVSAATAVCSVVLGFLAGYSFSKFRYSARRALMYSILVAQMVPQILLLLTLYSAFSHLGLLNSYQALLLAYTTLTLPLSVWMMKNTFDAIPDELLEAARIDGGGELSIMFRVLLPLVRTPLIAVGMFSFILAWNDLAFALTLVDTKHQTLPAGLTQMLLGEFQNSYGDLMAATLVTSLPVVAIFFALQKQLVSASIAGSIK